MTELFDHLDELRGSARKVAVATLVNTRGTTPRKEGAKMVVGEGGAILGVHAAADRHGAQDRPAFTDDHLGAFLARRRAAGVHERGDGHLAGGTAQLVEVIEELRHGNPMIRRAEPRSKPRYKLSLRARSLSAARLWPGAKTSTSGSAAVIPRVSGS